MNCSITCLMSACSSWAVLTWCGSPSAALRCSPARSWVQSSEASSPRMVSVSPASIRESVTSVTMSVISAGASIDQVSPGRPDMRILRAWTSAFLPS